MKINGIFFDLYGTLLIYGDMAAAWSDWLTEFYRHLSRHGLSLTKEYFAKQCDQFFGKDEPLVQPDGLTVFERRIQALCLDLKLYVEVNEIKRIANTIANVWQQHILLDPDCRPVLQALRPHKTLGIISNFDHPPHVFTLLSELELQEFFNVVVISGDVGVKKPDPKIFNLTLKEAGLQPNEVVYVGDTEEDVTGSLSAEIIPIFIQRARSDQDGYAFDFKTEYRSTQTQPNTKNMTSVRTIATLPELIDIVV